MTLRIGEKEYTVRELSQLEVEGLSKMAKWPSRLDRLGRVFSGEGPDLSRLADLPNGQDIIAGILASIMLYVREQNRNRSKAIADCVEKIISGPVTK